MPAAENLRDIGVKKPSKIILKQFFGAISQTKSPVVYGG